MHPYDVDLIQVMHTRLSSTTIYNRYLRGYAPNLEEIRQICQINTGFVATIATPGEQVIGMAYYVILEDGLTAEPAMLIEDRFQMQGIGTTLFRYLVEHACNKGIVRFSCIMSGSNEGAFRMVRRSGFPFTSICHYGVRDICIDLCGVNQEIIQ